MTQQQRPKTPQDAWLQAKTAAGKNTGLNAQLDALENEKRIPPDDADPELRELFIDTMVALKAAAAG